METAIKKAIEGGYKGVEMVQTDLYPVIMNGEEKYPRILLDPLFWQALGKAEGWKEEIYQYRTNAFTLENAEKGAVTLELRSPMWMYQWTLFILHIAEEKDADEFFDNLIK